MSALSLSMDRIEGMDTALQTGWQSRLRKTINSMLLIAVACLSVTASSAESQPGSPPKGPRLALIIANQNYASAKDRLGGPAGDAVMIQKALKKQGFGGTDGGPTPTVLFDQGGKQMKEQIVAFKKALEKAGPLAIGFFYYAGHGGADRAGKDNFLLPVDIQGIDSADIEKQGVGIRWITDRLQGIELERRPTIAVVVDACRTQAGSEEKSPTGQTRGASTSGGMVMPDNQQPEGLIVALSTGVGKTAGDSGIYAETLAEKIGESNVSIVNMFDIVKQDVARKTGGAQIPVYQSQILKNVCIVSCADAAELAKIRGELECNGLRPEDLELALRAENLDRVKTILKCKREFLLASEVRGTLSRLFKASEFPRRQAFLVALQAAGIGFVADLKPENPDADPQYAFTPLRIALNDRNVEGMSWLLSTARPEDLRAYPRLAAIYVKALQGLAESERHKALSMLTMLIRGGLPTEANEYEAFRMARRFWLETQFGAEHQPRFFGFQGRMWDQSFGTGRPSEQAEFWRLVADLVAPGDKRERKAITAKAGDAFAAPRINAIEGAEKQMRQMLAGSGLRQVEDQRSQYGYSNVDVPAGNLRDDDMVLDMQQLLTSTSWASVSGVRAQLKRLDTSKEVLRRLAGAE